MWGNTIVIHSVLKKKITKLNSQSVQYKKYIKLIKIIIKNKIKKILQQFKTCNIKKANYFPTPFWIR